MPPHDDSTSAVIERTRRPRAVDWVTVRRTVVRDRVSVTRHLVPVPAPPEPVLQLTGHPADPVSFVRRQLMIRRVLDVAVASIVMLFALPLMLAIAVAVRLTSCGPVLFRHERVGAGGRSFDVVKFRSMRSGTHDELHADPELLAEYVQNNFKIAGDSDRITPIGRMLRKSSLDELPQLLNVLRGDMSIVGVRPLVPLELAVRSEYDQALYCQLRPGITGLWQVSGRSTITDEERFALDRDYVRNWTIRQDVSILVRTPAALFRTHQAE